MSWMGFSWNTTASTHVKYNGKSLAPHQKEAVIRAEQNDPNCTGNTVIRNMRNVADEQVQKEDI